jgi:hypothetical protein
VPLRFLPVALLLSAPAVPLTAQVALDLHGGASFATRVGSEVGRAEGRTGLNVGASIVFPAGSTFAVQAGAGYVQKGATQPVEGRDMKLDVDYIELPLLLRATVSTSVAVSPHFMVGPALAFKVRCQATEIGVAGGTSTSQGCAAARVPTKSVDVGGMVGAGVEIATGGSLSLTVDAFFNTGLIALDESPVQNDVKNRAWSILAGVTLPIG